jgi:L-lactate dehydrogenase complex protein LldG
MSTRDSILSRIRAQQGRTGAASDAERAAAEQHIATRAIGPRPAVTGDLSARFRVKAEGLASTVEVVAQFNDAPAAVAAYLRAHRLPMSGVAWGALLGPARGLDWKAAGLELDSRRARDDDMVGITGVFCAIAETGTLMLVSGAESQASISLVPETHIAIVPVSRIVAYMEEAWALARAEIGDLPRAINFISGPSRTGDIEQTIVLGAHGPYRVHIVLVRGA